MISTTADRDESGIDEHLRQDLGVIRPPTGGVPGGLLRRTAGIEGTDEKAAMDPGGEAIGAVTVRPEDLRTAATKRMLVGTEAWKKVGMKEIVTTRGKRHGDSGPCRRQP